jgi:hypothetical protein
MAYPLTKMPTLGEFLAKASSYGVEVGVSTSEVVGPQGKLIFRYARRQDGPPVTISASDEEMLTPTTLSNLCRQLGVPPDEFGLVIGALAEPRHEGGTT